MPNSLLSHRLIQRERWPGQIRRACLVVAMGFLGMASSVAAVPMFRVLGPTTQPSYVLGTLHSDDPSVLAVADRVGCLMRGVDAVAIEIVPDAVVAAAAAAATLLPGEKRLADLVGDARWARLQGIAKQQGLPAGLIGRLKPWAAAVTLGLPMPRGAVLDVQIAHMASESGRRLVGLESVAEQIAVFDGMPLALQLELVDEIIKHGEEMPKALQALTAAYLAGDLVLLEDMAHSQYAGVSEALAGWFEHRLLQARNVVMVQRALELLLDESALIAVGALHLGGETGLLTGLQEAGFNVEAVRLEAALADAGCAP